MTKKIMLFLLIIFLSTTATAETCPDVTNIKAGNLKGWVALDSTDDSYARKEQIIQFEQSVQEFWLAEWTLEYPFPPDSPGRCYYHNDSMLEIYLAKQVPKPTIDIGHWKKSGNVDQCYSDSVNDCAFK
jgi:hypothetical protein